MKTRILQRIPAGPKSANDSAMGSNGSVQRRSAFRRFARLAGPLAVLVPALVGSAATPKLATAAQVGPSPSPGMQSVLLLWQPLEGFALSPAHAIYRKPGLAADPTDYALLSIVQPTADPATLGILLGQAAAAGLSPEDLDPALTAVLGGPNPGLGLAERLSLALTTNLPPARQQLLHDTLPRRIPVLAMALGRAHLAEVSSGEPSTFEIREYDPVSLVEGEVVGRVTVGTAPSALPAPGTLAERVETSPRGHLRVLLRWCTPLALSHRALHVSGYHLYRARRADWLQTHGAPPPATLTADGFAAAVASGLLVRVNRSPILPDTQYGCPGDGPADLSFVTDDHDSASVQRHEAGGTPFLPGEQVTYYAAALDHFRRPGMPSRGLDVVVCDRMPPLVPRQVRVDNRPSYDEATAQPGQSLVVSWERAPTNEVAAYWIYRWDSHDAPLRQAANPSISNRLARVLNTGPGPRQEFVDDGSLQLPTAPPAPQLPADAGRTFWYTVRAEDDTACKDAAGHGNLSGPGAPAFGVLRDWIGPAGGGGRLIVECCAVGVTFQPITAQFSNGVVQVRLVRQTNTVAWAEIREVQGQLPVRRYEFPDGATEVGTMISVGSLPAARLETRFGSADGQVSEWSAGLPLSPATPIPLHAWTAGLTCRKSGWPCDSGFVDPVDPLDGGITGICGEVSPATGAVEWRIYRRTGRSAGLVLIESAKFPTATWCDTGAPAVAETLCYYVQQFDVDGNPGAIVPLGCVDALGTEPFPRPEITRATVLPSPVPAAYLAPAVVDWFCPPPGVERFEVAFFPPPPGSAELVWLPVAGAQEAIGADHGVFQSPRLPAGFGNGGSRFSQSVPLASGVEYRVRVRAIRTRTANDGTLEFARGEWSDEVLVAFLSGDPSAGPEVPWPARPVPGIHPDFFPYAEWDTTEELARIEIGTFPAGQVLVPGTGTSPAQVRGTSLESYLTIPLPWVLYRHETSPGHRGEMTQVTPLVTGFLTTPGGTPGNPVMAVTDRFLVVRRRNTEPAGPYRLWIRDTQPAIAGKSYRHTFVRHRDDRELHEVLASTITAVPQ